MCTALIYRTPYGTSFIVIGNSVYYFHKPINKWKKSIKVTANRLSKIYPYPLKVNNFKFK